MNEPSTTAEARGRGHRHRVPRLRRRRLRARHPHRQRGRPLHHGRPRDDLPGVRHHRRRHRLRPRAHQRQPHQPRGDPRARRHRQVPVEGRPGVHRRPGRRCRDRCGGDHRRARPEGQRRRPRRRVVRRHCGRGPGLRGRVRRHLHPRVHRLRRDPPQGPRRVRRGRDRPRRLRRDHPRRADHRRLDQPGPYRRPDAGPADRRRHGAVGAAARLPRSPSSWPASSPPCDGYLARVCVEPAAATSGRPSTATPPGHCSPSTHAADHRTDRSRRSQIHEEAHQRTGRRRPESLLGVEAAHPELRVDHENKVIFRGDVAARARSA